MARASDESSDNSELPRPEELGSMHPSDVGAAGDPVGGASGPGTPSARRAGDIINGKYRLERRIDLRDGSAGRARGAFGEVWRASYLISLGMPGDTPHDREGKGTSQERAVKFIQPERADPKTLQRFTVTEPRALARLSHPFIARFYEIGWHGSDPFLVMEFVRGGSITTYADQEGLTLDQRIDLVIKVCEAMQHVHSQGLVHRDLKPDNILVTEVHGGSSKAGERAVAKTPIPKLIDFGLAKSTNAEPLDQSVASEVSFVGSRSYASPEQFTRRAHEEVDQAADVYAIGAILFELICGVSPMHHVLIDPTSSAAKKVACFASDERPSLYEAFERLPPADQERIAAARRTTPRAMRFALRGSLQWIQSAALRVEPKARISDVSKLREDLRNYLEGQPLRYVTREPWATRTIRRVRRRPVPYAATGAVILALAMGLAGTAWQKSVADEQRVRADERATAAEKAERAERERADQLKLVSEFQSGVLGQINTTQAGADLVADLCNRLVSALEAASTSVPEREERLGMFRRDLMLVNPTDAASAMIARTILAPAVKEIERRFSSQPLVDAQLRLSLGVVYDSIGLVDAAEPLLRAALATRQRLLGDDAPDTIGAMGNLGMVLVMQGKLSDAEPLLLTAAQHARRVLGEKHSDTIASEGNVGFLRFLQGNLPEAEQIYSKALAVARPALGNDHRCTRLLVSRMYSVLSAQGKLREAEVFCLEQLDTSRRVLGDDHSETINARLSLGMLLCNLSEWEKAEPYVRTSVAGLRRVLGEEHPETIAAIGGLPKLLLAQGQLEEAEKYAREALDKSSRVLGQDHPITLTAASNLAATLYSQKRYSDAEPYFREVAERSARQHGPDHPITLYMTANLGTLLQQEGKCRESVEVLSAIESKARGAFQGSNASVLANLLATLGRARVCQGPVPEVFPLAEANFLQSYELYVELGKHKDPRLIECVRNIIDLYTTWDRAEPGQGYDIKTAEWRARLDAAGAPDPAGR